MIADFGGVITQTNALLKTTVADLRTTYKVNVMYFDAYTFPLNAKKNLKLIPGAKYNYTCADGCTTRVSSNQRNFNVFYQAKVMEKKPNPFFWMTTNMPNSGVHKALAGKMASFLGKQSACYRNVTSSGG